MKFCERLTVQYLVVSSLPRQNSLFFCSSIYTHHVRCRTTEILLDLSRRWIGATSVAHASTTKCAPTGDLAGNKWRMA